MALRAGYYGLKKKLLEKVKSLPGIKSIGDGLSLNDTTGVLSATGGGGTTVIANPEEAATADLTKLQVGSAVYGIPAQPDITGKADITAIGLNETGITASRAYAVGDHFYKNGKFCTAIASIAQDATFTLNTNYIEGNIADNFISYSSQEQFTGRYWTDGKPVYEKSISFTGPNNATAVSDVIARIDKVISFDYLFAGTTSPSEFDKDRQDITFSGVFTDRRTNEDQKNRVFITSTGNLSSMTIYATVKYTKV